MPLPRSNKRSTIPTGTENKNVYAKWPFEYAGTKLFRHQVFKLIGHKVDEKLLAMGYCDYVVPAARTFQAPNGGPHFISEEGRDDYERERRRKEARAGLPEDPVEEDMRQARREKRLMEESPLRPQGGE